MEEFLKTYALMALYVFQKINKDYIGYRDPFPIPFYLFKEV